MVQTKECEPLAPGSATRGVDRRIYIAAAAASLVLSLWGAWAQFIPGTDAALYLRSAEQLADGRWTAAVATFDWPTYSALIAAAMKLTGRDAFLAAQIVNAAFAVVTTIAFIGLASRLANGDRLVVLCAAIVILVQPHLLELRPSIMRDNGYVAFFVLTLYLVARDVASRSRLTKLGIGAAIVAAGLFRIEGFLLGALVVIYYLARQSGRRRRPWAILAIIAAAFILLPGLLLWTSGTFGQWLTGHAEFGALTGRWVAIVNVIAARLHHLKYEFLFPYGGGNSWGAYIGMTLGIATVNIVREISIPLAILTVFAFLPKPLMSRPANGFVLWFAFGQLPLLLVFTFVMLFLANRYAAGVALVLDVPLAFVLAETIRQWRLGSTARFFLPITAIALVMVAAFGLPKPSKLGYLKEAGRWIGQQVPADAQVITNDARIGYFSGRAYGKAMRLWWQGQGKPTDAEVAKLDYFAIKAKDADSLPPFVASIPGKELVHSFAGKDGESVFVYARSASRGEGSGR